MPSVACWIQNPDVVGVPAASAQNVAMSSCACVRVSEIARISLSSARNAVDPNAGGGADRNWLAEVRNQGRTPGNDPPATDAGVASLNHSPAPTGMVPANGAVKPSALARVTMAAPTPPPIGSPRTNASGDPAEAGFRCDLRGCSRARAGEGTAAAR